jgi:hypothetical protein
MRTLICVLLLASAGGAQQPPNLTAQREAMKKLEFLVGKWSGEASVVRGPGEPLRLTQTEDVQFKLDGLVLLVEGTGRNADGRTAFRALATISFDDATGTYHFRAYNDGRYLDTELTVGPGTFAWGFTAGPVKVENAMKLSDKGEWVETSYVTMGTAPPRRTVEMKLHKL